MWRCDVEDEFCASFLIEGREHLSDCVYLCSLFLSFGFLDANMDLNL